MEAARVGADKLGERPVEGSAAADGGVRVTLERRLVHRHHHPRRRRRICHCSARTHACSLGLPSSARRRGVLGENFEQRTKGKAKGSKAVLFLSLAPINLLGPPLASTKQTASGPRFRALKFSLNDLRGPLL